MHHPMVKGHSAIVHRQSSGRQYSWGRRQSLGVEQRVTVTENCLGFLGPSRPSSESESASSSSNLR
ncbi:hypothetical protein PMAYCL1PPCAC_21517, partial [Pristionchus mayeri]